MGGGLAICRPPHACSDLRDDFLKRWVIACIFHLFHPVGVKLKVEALNGLEEVDSRKLASHIRQVKGMGIVVDRKPLV